MRLCTDPDNLPFSSASAAQPGFYIELGADIAQAMGRSFQPVWVPTYYPKRQIRMKMLTGQCDGFIGVPDDASFMGPRLIFSQPIIEVGYALVAPAAMDVTGVANLHGRRVAVQYASPPQSLLATESDVQTVTALSPEEAMQDLADGKADAAFIWGPSAGWLNASLLHSAYQVVAVPGDHKWSVGIAFPRGQTELRDLVDHALATLRPSIDALLVKYDFPAHPASSAGSSAPAARLETAQSATPESTAPAAPTASGTSSSPPASNDQAGGTGPRVEDIAAGRSIFNSTCSHCHGHDALQGEQRRNLRMLRARYGDQFPQVFMTTVTHGRLSKGMPNWSGIISDDEFHKILAFLTSVQESEAQ